MSAGLLGCLASVVLIAGACGGERGGSAPGMSGSQPDVGTISTGPPASGPATSSRSVATTVDPISHEVEGVWEQTTVLLDTAGIATQSDIPPDVPEAHVIGSTESGYLVAGSVNGGFAVWRSADLMTFDPIYSEACCERSLRATSIDEFVGSILIGGTGEFGPERAERGFLLRSDDNGVSWTLIEDPLFASVANRVDQIVVTRDSVIVETVDDRGSGEPQFLAAWSDDLVSWHPIELPGHADDAGAWLVHDDEAVYALTSRTDSSRGGFAGWTVWRSVDGGRSFTTAPPLEATDMGGLVVADGALVAVPSVRQDEYLHADPQGHAVLGTDAAWNRFAADTGTWGDGEVYLFPDGTASSTDHTYAMVSRTNRASVHYCYDDAETCQQHETVLLATGDGTTWLDVAGFPTPLQRPSGAMSLTASASGDVVLLAATHQDPEIHVTRWTGASAPPTVERPDYTPPSIPLPLYDPDQPLEIGDERRYPLALGGCGDLYLGDQPWEPDTPLPDPLPPTWPYRSVEVNDGPTGFVYGHVRRLSTDAVEYSIGDIGPVATFHPAPPAEFGCG